MLRYVRNDFLIDKCDVSVTILNNVNCWKSKLHPEN